MEIRVVPMIGGRKFCYSFFRVQLAIPKGHKKWKKAFSYYGLCKFKNMCEAEAYLAEMVLLFLLHCCGVSDA